MKSWKTAILTGTAALVVAGAGVAWARAPYSHVLVVSLPDGAVEQIRYSGPVAPRVTLAPVAQTASADGLLFAPFVPVSFFETAFGVDSPFAYFDRMAADMNRRAEAMLREAAALDAAPSASGPVWASWDALPAGSSRYSIVSTTSGNGVCTRSVRITARGDGKAPQVVRQSSGDCGSGGAAATGAPALLQQAPAAPSGITRTALQPGAGAAAPHSRATT